jgi:PPK2 family polyphosphate:nucleotide phosphotransferase
MMIHSRYLARPGKKVNLASLDPADTGHFQDKAQAAQELEKLRCKLQDLQEILYAQARHAVLVVFQAMDTGGKDGAIRHVFGGVNPQGCSVHSFKVPSATEAAHDFLWRIHAAVPGRGVIGIFNRSHYESVLVERVKRLVPELTWSRRFEHINNFERMLTDDGVTIIKFFLHISKAEQKERLEARLSDPSKHWKFNPGDLAERKLWGKYMKAYQDAIEKCSTTHAPWYIVPSDKKWFRNWVVSSIIVQTMERLHLRFPSPIAGIEKIKVE